MNVICIANQKGGVGKTTISMALGAGLRKVMKSVLYIDLDQQGNLSHTLQIDPDIITAYEVLVDGENINDAIQVTKHGDAIASSKMLAKSEKVIDGVGSEYRLKEAICKLSTHYDYVIIDTPPALGILTVNALAACNGLLIPAQADPYSLQGIGQLSKTIRAIKTYTNPEIKILGIVLNRHDWRTILGRDMAKNLEEVAEQLSTVVFRSALRETVIVKEAQTKRTSIYDYDSNSKAARDCIALTEEFLKRVEVV